MNTIRSLLLAGAALAGLAPAGAKAQAQEASVREVTVTATRNPTPLDQVGSSVSVVTTRQIQDEQLQTVPDLLQLIPGLNVVQTGGPGGATSIFMRGTNSNQVKVLVDGIDVSDTSNVAGAFDFAHLLTNGIERVEVLRGPQSGVYGSDAIGGVINVITKGGSGPFEAEVSAEGGTFESNNEAASLSGQAGNFHYAVNLAHDHAGATPVTPLELLAPGETRIDDSYDNLSASTKLGLDLSKDFDLGFTGRATETHLRFTGDDFSVFPSVPAPQQSASHTQQYYLRGYAHLTLLDGRFEQTAGLAYSSDRRAELNWPAPAPDIFRGSRSKFDWRGDVRVLPGEVLTLGAEHDAERYHAPITAGTDINSGYAQLQSTLGDFSNAANFRYDANSAFGNKATFRIAPSVLVRRLGLQLKGSYGTGFKAPSLDELFHDYPAFGFFANPSLRPESSKGWDVGFEQRLDHGKARFGATWFHNQIKDLIESNATFTSLVNIGRARTLGVEAFAAYAPSRSFALRLDYTYTKAWNEDSGQELQRRPRHKLSAQADWRPAARLQISGTVVHVGSWIDSARDFTVTGLTAPGYTLVDVAASYDLTSHLAAYGRVTNLGDARYQNPTGALGPSRGVFGGLRARF